MPVFRVGASVLRLSSKSRCFPRTVRLPGERRSFPAYGAATWRTARRVACRLGLWRCWCGVVDVSGGARLGRTRSGAAPESGTAPKANRRQYVLPVLLLFGAVSVSLGASSSSVVSVLLVPVFSFSPSLDDWILSLPSV